MNGSKDSHSVLEQAQGRKDIIMAQTYVAITSPGLEDLLLEELRKMKIKRPKKIEGGVEFEATSRGFYEVLLWSRIAHRVMLRVTEFRARDQRECYKKTRRFEWERLFGEGANVAIRGVVHSSYIYGSGALSKSVMDGIRDRYAFDKSNIKGPFLEQTERGRSSEDQLMLLARCEEDRCELSLEGSSGSMHRRGWRKCTGSAPLRESIAAAMLQAIDWDPATEPLLDPMCGSGTILIEAMRKSLSMLPRLDDHDYGVRAWDNFKPEQFEKLQSLHPQKTIEGLKVIGRDQDAEVLKCAGENAKRAGVKDFVRFEHVAFADGQPPEDGPRGWIVSNPPYGERIEDGEILRELGEGLRERFKGWNVALLLSEKQRPPRIGSVWKERLVFRNGGLNVKLWVGQVPE